MEEKLVCQSCSMPIMQNEHIGTNKDGSRNSDYCVFCFKEGGFVQNMSLDEFIEHSLQFASEVGMSTEDFRAYCNAKLPTLKRWQCTCTDECASGFNPNCTCTSSECHCTENSLK